MRHQVAKPLHRSLRPRPTLLRNKDGFQLINRRSVQISATPSTASRTIEQDFSPNSPGRPQGTGFPDARFEVLGAPYSLLSVSLSASQNLYTRRGTLVGVSGKPDNAVSALSLLEPFRRAVLGIPFLYQRISSSSPLTALISTKSPITSFTVVHLDGRLDWMVAQRQALLAWTGHSLSIKPTLNTQLSLAHWGNSRVTGRGLLALAGKGQVYQILLKAGEEYTANPGNVLAYSVTNTPPQPYRFKSTSLRFQIPSVNLGFFRTVSESPTWKALSRFFFGVRSWARRLLRGDRLFLQFTGPTTILIQSRGSRLRDVLTQREVNELADTPAGAVHSAVSLRLMKEGGHGSSTSGDTPAPDASSTRMSYATVGKDGKVEFQSS